MTTAAAIGWAVTAVSVVGVLLNNRRLRSCFLVWLASNAASFGLHAAAGMTGLAVRDAAFFALAIQGYVLWGRRK